LEMIKLRGAILVIPKMLSKIRFKYFSNNVSPLAATTLLRQD
jgi:hypothetical protein